MVKHRFLRLFTLGSVKAMDPKGIWTSIARIPLKVSFSSSYIVLEGHGDVHFFAQRPGTNHSFSRSLLVGMAMRRSQEPFGSMCAP